MCKQRETRDQKDDHDDHLSVDNLGSPNPVQFVTQLLGWALGNKAGQIEPPIPAIVQCVAFPRMEDYNSPQIRK